MQNQCPVSPGFAPGWYLKCSRLQLKAVKIQYVCRITRSKVIHDMIKKERRVRGGEGGGGERDKIALSNTGSIIKH